MTNYLFGLKQRQSNNDCIPKLNIYCRMFNEIDMEASIMLSRILVLQIDFMNISSILETLTKTHRLSKLVMLDIY